MRLSQMGDKCPRQLWYSVHRPEMAEQMPAWVEFKYLFGHIIEGVAVSLMKAAGHSVVGEQDELNVDGVLGHRDCVVDGCILDVKSCSSPAFKRFEDGSIKDNDPFGYMAQLDGYICGSLEDPLVTVKDRGYLLAIDKQLGHMCIYEHRFRQDYIRSRIFEYKEIVALREPPSCTCGTRPHGESGNIALDVRASYNPYKYCCFPSLRTFIYAKGPVYLTRVVRKPDALEVDKHGKPVYNVG